MNADFSVSLRSNAKYNNAGFSIIKVRENMACGTLVIVNISIDLGNYIVNKNMGLVCQYESAKNCVTVIRKTIDFTAEDKRKVCFMLLTQCTLF